MDARDRLLDGLAKEIRAQRLGRRDVLKRGAALGLSAPLIATLLAACGGDDDETDEPAATVGTGGSATEPVGETPEAEATEGEPESASSPEAEATEAETGSGGGRGQGDLLRLLIWQAPTILNPHLSQGTKDNVAARLILEPLANIMSDGSLDPVLAAEVPTLENGGVAADGMSVTWKLKPNVVWSDGEPFTSADVEFTWQYAVNEEVATTTFATYSVISEVEVVDDHTITLKFSEPNPAWFNPFCGGEIGPVLPKHVLADALGAEARNAPFNLSPIGTGPYKLKEFRPGDTVLYEINENFRDPDKPFFPSVELKGGGDASSAARAVVQSGETDFAWNLQIEKAVAEQLTASGNTGVLIAAGTLGVEQLLLNFADPNTEVDGARSEPGTVNPLFEDKRVRDALRLSCDRETIATQLYGEVGSPTPNTLTSPTSMDSPNTSMEYDLDKATALLDEAGWTADSGTRSKDGKQLSILSTTTVNPVRQKTQEVLKQSWEEIGFAVELKSIDAGVYFSSDAGNPDTVAHFYADVTMFTNGTVSTYPLEYMAAFKSNDPDVDIAQKSNSWAGGNYHRWVNEDFNKLWTQAQTELDPDTQVELFVGMNDLVINEVVRIGLVNRKALIGFSNRMRGHVTSDWEMEVYDIQNWYAEE